MSYEMNPPWIDRVLNKHWEAIVDEAPEAGGIPLAPVVASESKRGKLTFEEYGCGHYGCVMPTADPGTVFKVSSDVSEAAFVAQVCELGYQAPGVVRYHKIREIKGVTHRGRRVFILWRQEAYHVGELSHSIRYANAFTKEIVDKYGARDVMEFLKHLDEFQKSAAKVRDVVRKSRNPEALLSQAQNLEDWAWDAVRRAPGRMKAAEKIAYYRRECEMSAEVMANIHVCYLIGQAFEHYIEEGMLLADVHLGNIGQAIPFDPDYSSDHLLITDPGHMVPLRKDRLSVRVPTLGE